jgi:deoxyribodipyrimidine photo-lyase
MRNVPQAWLFQPWLIRHDTLMSSEANLDIVEPLVDLATATRGSKQRLHQLRQTPSVRAGKKEVVEKHASRKKPKSVFKPSSLQSENKQQMEFDF